MDKEKETTAAGLAEFWLWPFGMWKAATDSWINYMTGFLGVDGRRIEKPVPLPGLAVDPWAVMRIWMPQVDTIIEPLSQQGQADDAVRVRMQLPGLGASGVVAIDAVVARERPVAKPAEVIDVAVAPQKVATPRKAPVRRSTKAPAADAPAPVATPETAATTTENKVAEQPVAAATSRPRRPRKPAEPKA